MKNPNRVHIDDLKRFGASEGAAGALTRSVTFKNIIELPMVVCQSNYNPRSGNLRLTKRPITF